MDEEHLNSINSPFRYNGKILDEETGNYYYSARYYDPKFSIFISVDPLVLETGDAYGYCYQNPINLVDPTGMEGEGVENRYKAVWNDREQRYDYTLVSKMGGDEMDYVDYQGGRNNGQIIAFKVRTERSYFYEVGSQYHTIEIERRPGYQKLLKNTFAGHAIQPVTVGGALSDVAIDYIEEETGSPTFALAVSLVSLNPKKALGALAKGSKGDKLAQKLLKHSNDGEYKIWPGGTKDFGKNSKNQNIRITTDDKGGIIGH